MSRTRYLQVFEGNSGEDPLTKKKNDLTDVNLVASMIRIWPVRSNGSCTQVELYGQTITDNTLAGTEKICLKSVSQIPLGLIIFLKRKSVFSRYVKPWRNDHTKFVRRGPTLSGV